MVGKRDEVFPALIEQLLAEHSDGLLGTKAFPGVLGPGDDLAIGDALDVEQQIFEFVGWIGHESDAYC